MTKAVSDLMALGAASVIAITADGALPASIKLMPMGTSMGRDGQGPYRLEDRAHAEAVVAASQAKLNGLDPVIDYDHQTDYAATPGNGGQAPAAGWITKLEARDDGIYGAADWTALGAQRLSAKEYRYISPVFYHRPDGRVTLVMRAALTNNPNLDLPALASQRSGAGFTGDDGMTFAKIAAALSLAATADEGAILTSIAGMQTAAKAIASALGAKDDASGDDVLALASQAKVTATPDPAKFVPIGDLQAVAAQVTTLKTELSVLQAKDVAAEVEAQIGKTLVPSQRDWAIALASSDRKAFDDYLKGAPDLGLTKVALEGGKTPEAKPGDLTADEKAICAQIGITEADYILSKGVA
jgi:phage I-like protein